MSRRKPRIAIVGAGLGGLTCAVALRRAGFEVQVFDRDTSPEERLQGFVVNLEKGLEALDRLELGDKVRSDGYPTPDLRIFDHRGRRLARFASRDAFSVGRPRLRRILLAAVEEEIVTWGARCVGYEEDADGATCRFQDGRRHRADLVVGCDGVRSVIRQQMHGDSLVYLGVAIIGGEVGSEEAGVAEIKALRGGKFMTLTRRGSCYATVYSGENRIRWSYGRHAEEGELERGPRDPAELKQEVLARVEGWIDPVPSLVRATDPASVQQRGVYDRDPLRPWRTGRVTLLGDAAHPMSPYRGLGANLAIQDAVSLAEALSDVVPANLPVALQKYERAMLRRAEEAQRLSRLLARMFHWEGWVAVGLRNTCMRLGSLLRRVERTAT